MAKLGIEILIRKMLKPSAPAPNDLRSLNLSLFDQLALRVYVSILLCTAETSCNKPQQSLTHTLTKFYPRAKRFRENDHQLSVQCNDKGVEYVKTKVNAGLAEFLPEGPDNRLPSPILGTTKDCLPIGLGHSSPQESYQDLNIRHHLPKCSTTRPKMVTKRFVFDALAITNLKNTIQDSTASSSRRPTRVVVHF
ncbi:acetyl-CoA-benzylalcohol acetyltransferase-like [Solanum pennellii]|uniref:Acetyl-CoA-benzylalcohol acetyltransferase-like n=1 Tax=Solanum pennellii TaxID=28526 RepID=A0ABM1H739_SOLPN|nr:acetyl-CoA-benzylalcohol acetyltransferase-like [Solanum pennellii]